MTTLQDHGVIRVHCDACASDDVWLKCDTCAKSANFLLGDEGFTCHCGASYGHAVCTCGARVGREGLAFVPFEEGPASLADFEISWPRVGILVASLAGIGLGLWYFVSQSLG